MYKSLPVTRTLKGNENQFDLQLELLLGFELSGVECKIQFAMLKLIVTDFSALQCIVQYKSNLFHQKR